MPRPGFVYILTNKKYGTLYVGVTSDLARRIEEHKGNTVPGFTSRYNLHRLVYCEWHERIGEAIEREKKLKRWKRKWKIDLIERINPAWNDLSSDLT